MIKLEKRPPKSLKNEMFIFGLRSISDDWLSNPSDEHQPKCQKRPPHVIKKLNAQFWITFNF